MKPVPTESDWRSVPFCLDTAYAFDHFFGKTRQEALQLLVENSLCYQEDFFYIPTPCLEYYIEAYKDYLLLDASRYDGSSAAWFMIVMDFRQDNVLTLSPATIERMRQVLKHLALHQAWYDADRVHGSFPMLAEQGLNRLKSS